MTASRTVPLRSGLLVPVPEAEPIVGALRARHDPVAPLGIPAHVTVLFPFVPATAVDEDLDDVLRSVFGALAPFAYRFARIGRFGDTTVYLEPESADSFAALTRRVVAQWPHYPPYEGAFAVVIPHLTIGDQLPAGVADDLQGEAQRALDEHGPVTGQCSEVLLMTEGTDDHWSTVGRYPLAR